MQYLRAIEAQDWQQMAALLHDEAHYFDPTMAYFDLPPVDLSGAEAIVEFWRTSSEDSGTSQIRYTITQCFHTPPVVVINMDIAVDLAGSTWNVDKETVTMTGPLVTVLTPDPDTGKIKEHVDYVHYASSTAWMRELQEKYGKLKE